MPKTQLWHRSRLDICGVMRGHRTCSYDCRSTLRPKTTKTAAKWNDIVIFNIHMYDIYIYTHTHHTHTYTNMILLFETWAKPKIMFYPPQQPRTSFLNAFSGCVLCATCVRKSYWWHHMNEGYTVCRLDQYVSFGLCIHRLAWNRCGTPYGSTQ